MAYRKLSPLLWDDAWFVALDDFHRNVWLAVLTGPQVRQIPGLMVATAVTIADYLRRDTTAVSNALARFCGDGRIEVDPTARVLRVINAPRWAAEHGEPENPNVIKGWWKAWKELPESPVRNRHLRGIREAFLLARNRAVDAPIPRDKQNDPETERARRAAGWDSAWGATFGTVPEPPETPPPPSSKRFRNGSPNHSETVSEPFPNGFPNRFETVSAHARTRDEQEQEQEQEQEPEPINTPLPPAPRGDGAPEVRQPAPEAPMPARAARAKPAALGLPGVGTEAADDVFAAHVAAWRRVVGKGSPPVLDDKRRRRVRRWVEQGVAVEQLKAAAAGIFDSDWHTAEENRGHLTFEVALRDAGQIEKFARLFADAEATRMPEARPTPKAPAWMSQAPRPRFRNLDILREADAAKAAGAQEDDPFAGLEDAMLRPEATDVH